MISILRCGAVAVTLLLAAACSPSDGNRKAASAPSPGDERVVALAPSAVEMIYELGWGDRLVGVGSYVSWPPEAEDLPRLGGLVDADLERILLLEPDLVVLLESEVDLAARLDALDVEVLTVPADSLDDIGRAAELIAERFGDPERGVRWRQELDAVLAASPVDRRLLTLLTVGREQGKPVKLLVPGEGTYLGALVGRAGGEAAVEGFGEAYREIDLSTALAAQPEVILEFNFDAVDAEVRAADWRSVYPEQAELPCHRAISGSHVVVPGPRVDRLYAEIVEALTNCHAGNVPSANARGDMLLSYDPRIDE